MEMKSGDETRVFKCVSSLIILTLAWGEVPHAHGGISQQLFGKYTTDHVINGTLHRETLFFTLSTETMLQIYLFSLLTLNH